MCTVELKKVPMFEFHCHYIKKNYGIKLRLLFPDTDNLVYEIEIQNVYDNFSKNREMLDLRWISNIRVTS